MSLDEKEAQALRDMQNPEMDVHAVELTPEVKKRLADITCDLLDDLVKRTNGPVEGYMVLHFLMAMMEKRYGIRGGVAITEKDVARGS